MPSDLRSAFFLPLASFAPPAEVAAVRSPGWAKPACRQVVPSRRQCAAGMYAMGAWDYATTTASIVDCKTNSGACSFLPNMAT